MTPSASAQLVDRNAGWVAEGYTPGLRMVPALKTIVIGCVDPRVDPTELLAARPGEIAVLRNVGGRVTPEVLRQLVLLRAVSLSAGGDLGAGWELVVLQHTDCGITRIQGEVAALAEYLGVDEAELAQASIADPEAAVRRDVDLLRAMDGLGAGVLVSGLVYDVVDGSVTPVS